MVKPMKSKLKHLNLELTNRCNYRCVSCPTTFSKFMRGDISSDLFKSILDETGYHIKKIYFWNYGESLLHPDVVNLFEYVRKYSCKKIVSTNGSNLNCFTNLNFLTALDEIILSINGLTQNTYQFHQVCNYLLNPSHHKPIFYLLLMFQVEDLKLNLGSLYLSDQIVR